MQGWFTEKAAGATELIDDADKRSDNDKYLDRRYRKASAYEALDHLLTTALDKSATLQSEPPYGRVGSTDQAPYRLSQGLARAGALARPLAGRRGQDLTNLLRGKCCAAGSPDPLRRWPAAWIASWACSSLRREPRAVGARSARFSSPLREHKSQARSWLSVFFGLCQCIDEQQHACRRYQQQHLLRALVRAAAYS
jgi:hypothetical protein